MPFDTDPTREFESLFSDRVEHELRGTFTATLAVVRTIDDTNQRATVAPKREPAATIPNVPIAAPYARDGAGDIHPLEPGDEGLILCPHEAIDDLVTTRGHQETTPDSDRHHELTDAVFLPAAIYYDEDTVPDHERGERVFSHPSGATIRQCTDGSIKIEHPLGVDIELGGVPEAEPSPGEKHWGEDFKRQDRESDMVPDTEETDNTSYPPPNEGDHHVRISHDVGVELTLTERGIAITNGETDAGNDVRDVVSGQPNDGDRIELDGHHQHRHVIPRPDGTYELTGPPLSFRQFLAQFDEAGPDVATLDGDHEAEAAREYAAEYIAWLEDQVGQPLDPTDEELWPTDEPMPTPDEKADFDPEN